MRLINFFRPLFGYRVGHRMIAISCCLFAATVMSLFASTGMTQLRADLIGLGMLVAVASDEVKPDQKPVGDFRKDLKSFMKRSKQKDDPAQRYGAIVDLCFLHDQIVNDSRFSVNQQLKGFRSVAADRLKKCRREIEIDIKREERELAKQAKRNRDPEADATKDRRKKSNDDGGLFDDKSDTAELSEQQISYLWQAEDMDSITRMTGGPIRIWSYSGGSFAGPLCDHGPDLVRLIESTINPDSWRTNGGNGVIEYYQPLRILVVGASSKIHDDMTDLLRTLRNNSR